MSLPPNLANEIRAYLTQPDVDLQTVSAKQIRRHLGTIFPSLDVRALKDPIDEISIPIFTEISEAAAAEAFAAGNLVAVEAQAEEPPASPISNPALPSHPTGLALPSRGGIVNGLEPSTSSQLSSNRDDLTPGHSYPRYSQARSSSSKLKTPGSASKKNKRKSAAYVDSEDDEHHETRNGTPKPKKSGTKKPRTRSSDGGGGGGGGTGSNKGIHKELNCSPALAEVIGVLTCSRPQVVKKIWDYIKANSLQDPKDKRQILCDERLKNVFNVNSVHMFTMNKLLGEHLWTNDEVVQPTVQS